MMTGLFHPTSGAGFIYGKSIKTQMDEIRRFTGVCPQHDILWNELTAMEHLDLFARLKAQIPLAHAMHGQRDVDRLPEYPCR